MDELKAIIRSLAISSASGMTLSQLDRDFKSLEGCNIPYQNHGFKSLLSMLRTLTDVVQVNGNDEHSSTIHPVTTEKNHHIRSMVEKSKKSKKKTVTVHRRPTSSWNEPSKSKHSSSAKRQYHGKSSNTAHRYNSKSSTGTQQYNSNGTYANRNTWRTRGRNVTSQNDYFHHDKHFDKFIKELNSMLAAQQYGQYNWYGTNVNNGTPYNFHYPSSDMSSYWNNQQYYQNCTQQTGWNYNNAGWNCNQTAASKKNYNTNNYPANDWNWNGYYPQNWVAYNNMYNNNAMGYNNTYNNNSMGYNNNAAGYNANQLNRGMGNYMNYGYNNNYSSNACNNGYSYYDLSAWYNAYGQYYS